MAFLSTVDIIIEIGKYYWYLPKGHRVQSFMQVLIRVSGKTLQIYLTGHTMTQMVINDSCCNKALCGLTKLKFSSHQSLIGSSSGCGQLSFTQGLTDLCSFHMCSAVSHPFTPTMQMRKEFTEKSYLDTNHLMPEVTCCLHFRNYIQSNKWSTQLPRRLENVCKHIGNDEHQMYTPLII